MQSFFANLDCDCRLFVENPEIASKLEQRILDLPQANRDIFLIENMSDLRRDPQKVLDNFDSRLWGCITNSHIQECIEKENEEFDHLMHPPATVEGVFQCGKCQNRRIITHSKQTRRGDESITVFAICTVCKHRWRV